MLVPVIVTVFPPLNLQQSADSCKVFVGCFVGFGVEDS